MSAPAKPQFLLSWRPASVLAVVAVWTGLAAFTIIGAVFAFQRAGRPLDIAPFATIQTISWYSCAVFTPLYVWMARRWPIERSRWRVRVPLWLVAVALTVPAKFAIDFVVIRALLPNVPRPGLTDLILSGFVSETIALWAMVAVIMCVEYYDRWRFREVQTHVLGRQLAEARLEVLSAQLRPHFLFNTLQGISTLLHRDPRAADQMLTRLSDLLRESLQHAETPEVTLADELATLEHYLAIQRIRFEDRLQVRVDADGASNAFVPHFVLQPLVENAIEHGVARRAGPGVVDVSAHVRGDRLVLEVSDDGGSGGEAPPRVSNGVGLANTRARLDALYGDAASLVAAPRANGGFTVSISIPLRRAGLP